MAALQNQIRIWLILGRVSNVPTVWSNCLAAWLLNAGGLRGSFYVLCFGTTLLYVGGMFLNDAFDVQFDVQFRKERPIPSGQIAARAVWWIGGGLLLLGLLTLLWIGTTMVIPSILLVGAIVLYDAVHKRTVLAPWLMALCRFLLIYVAAAATLRPVGNAAVWHGLALASYIAGVSLFARSESGLRGVPHWSVLLLASPLVAILILVHSRDLIGWVACASLLAWVVLCVRGLLGRGSSNVGRMVAGLLAGIVLLDGSAVPRLSGSLTVGFIGLFLLALILQRKIPAT